MAASVTFVPNVGGLDRLLRGPDSQVARALYERALMVETQAKINASGSPNVDTGRYRSSIQTSMKIDSRGPVAVVGAYTEYALGLEVGTRPHVIRPRNKKALYWVGAAHPVRMVRHPGTRAYYVLRRALLVIR